MKFRDYPYKRPDMDALKKVFEEAIAAIQNAGTVSGTNRRQLEKNQQGRVAIIWRWTRFPMSVPQGSTRPISFMKRKETSLTKTILSMQIMKINS